MGRRTPSRRQIPRRGDQMGRHRGPQLWGRFLARARRAGAALPGRAGHCGAELCKDPRDEFEEAGDVGVDVCEPGGL